MANQLEGNCKLEGSSEMFLDSSAEDMVVHGNEGLDEKKVAAAQDAYLEGISFKELEKPMAIGPEFAAESSAYHLGISSTVFPH